MSVTVRVPTTLRTLTGGASEVALEGATVGEVLTALDQCHAHPELGGPDRRDVPTVAAADDDEIELLRHVSLLYTVSSSGRSSSRRTSAR